MADNATVRKLAISVSNLRQYPVQSMEAVKSYINTGWRCDSLKFDNNAWEWTFRKGELSSEKPVSAVAKQIVEQAISDVRKSQPLGWAFNCIYTEIYTWWADGSVTCLPCFFFRGYLVFHTERLAGAKSVEPIPYNSRDFNRFHPYEAA